METCHRRRAHAQNNDATIGTKILCLLKRKDVVSVLWRAFNVKKIDPLSFTENVNNNIHIWDSKYFIRHQKIQMIYDARNYSLFNVRKTMEILEND